MLSIKGTVFDIQRFSIHDGPGIRTTVFLKGCPLGFIRCHNPESQDKGASLAFYQEKCTSCGACVAVCPKGCHEITDGRHAFDRGNCIACGKCAEACAFDALTIFGAQRSAEDVLTEVLRDKAFYESSGGGITVSGGEPLMQKSFLIALLKGAKAAGLHTCIETSGFASEETMREVAEYTDLFLFDIKETDEKRHEALTDAPFSPIKKNLFLPDSLGKNTVLRCPLIPSVNTDAAHIEGIAKIAARLENLCEINVMAYHTLGSEKYGALGMENKTEGIRAMTADERKLYAAAISEAIARITDKTISVI